MQLETLITELVKRKLEGTDLFLVELKTNSSGNKIQVYIDGDNGVSIGTCAEVSRAVSHGLDEAELPDNRFTFEISSPGVDQPLKLLRQYPKHIGRKVEVMTTDGVLLRGKLGAVSENELALLPELGKVKGPDGSRVKKESAGPVLVSVESIKETKVLLSFK
jgi:ribosome maturation factor RimP